MEAKLFKEPKLEDITPEERLSLSYLNYPGKPLLLKAREAIKGGELQYCRSGKVIFQGKTIDPMRQFDMVGAVLFGLNDALVDAEKGSGLRSEFNKKFARYSRLSEKARREYGYYAYYPSHGDLVHFPDPEDHRLALVTSNSSLYLDLERRMSWEEVRAIFDKSVLAVAGASVGNNVLFLAIRDMLPGAAKIADLNFFKVPNANRVRLGYHDIVWSQAMQCHNPAPWGLKNKAMEAAMQIHELDPFMNMWAYHDGVTQQNIHSFVAGNRIEPGATVVVEETDNPDVKMLIREACRREGRRVIMASDEGSAVQIDIRPFDVDPSATLAFGVSDDELYQKRDDAKRSPGDKTAFFRFADALIGDDYRTRGEFGALTRGDIAKLFMSIPQLGSTAAAAGGIVAGILARSALNYKFPERFIVDLTKREIKSWGELV